MHTIFSTDDSYLKSRFVRRYRYVSLACLNAFVQVRFVGLGEDDSLNLLLHHSFLFAGMYRFGLPVLQIRDFMQRILNCYKQGGTLVCWPWLPLFTSAVIHGVPPQDEQLRCKLAPRDFII